MGLCRGNGARAGLALTYERSPGHAGKGNELVAGNAVLC